MLCETKLREAMSERWLERLDAGDVWLVGEIADEMADTIVYGLTYSDETSLRLFVDSDGGDMAAAFSIHDAIRRWEGETEAFALGQVCSSSILPYLACDRRFATMHTSFMVHEPLHSLDNEPLVAAYGACAWWARYRDAYISILEDRTTGDSHYWLERIKADPSYLPIDEALRVGLFHEIWAPEES